MAKILLVEDDKELLELFKTILEAEGHDILLAHHGLEAIRKIENFRVDLIITDAMMPEMDGYELIQTLRLANHQLPILMITALGGMNHKRSGFNVGTDDYMVKPIDVNEMVWRVEALLRRSKIEKDLILKHGDTVLNQDALTLSFNDDIQELTQKEFKLLFKLTSSMNKIFTRRQIFEDVWGTESDTDFHTLDVHISRLRLKLKDNQDIKIVTVRGLGYKVVACNDEN